MDKDGKMDLFGYQIKELKEKVASLEKLLKFHNLDKIPVRYRNAFSHEPFVADFPKKIQCHRLDDMWGSEPYTLDQIPCERERIRVKVWLKEVNPSFKGASEVHKERADNDRNYHERYQEFLKSNQ